MDKLPQFNEQYSETLVQYAEIDNSIISQYKDILPEELIALWEKYGFFQIDNGLLWFVNPNDYKEVIEEWKNVNEMLTFDDSEYSVIARTAFGCLLIWVGDGDNSYLARLNIITNEWSAPATNMDFFFNVLLLDWTYKEDDLDEILFKECYENLGLLAPDECYGFVPLPALGGAKDVKFAEKVKLNEYLSICAQVW